jgi:hypothetical protein
MECSQVQTFKKPSAPALDCSRCTPREILPLKGSVPDPQAKCCRFNPFVSGISLGAWLAHGGDPGDLIHWTSPRGIWTVFGLAQPLDRGEPVGQRVCQFYQLATKSCGIWTQRPPVCRAYFCAHASQRQKQAWARWEDAVIKQEAQWLMGWYVDQGVADDSDWQAWVQYMDSPWGGELPQSFLLSPKQALVHYKALYQWWRTTFQSESKK